MQQLGTVESMILKEVISSKDQKIFLEMPESIYKGDPDYVRPLDNEVTAIFDHKQNSLLKLGACKRWLLTLDNGQCIGRIAAFYKVKTGAEISRRIGGIGFFECINDQMAANLLFDQARYWLEDMGISVMHGPINFGSRHNWWGLMITGEGKPNFCANYHPPYYRMLFENYGFTLNYKQLTFRFEQQQAPSNFFKSILKRFTFNDGFEFKQADPIRWLENLRNFQLLFNKTWAVEERLPELSLDDVLNMVDKLKDVLDWRLVWFAYYNGTPIAFFAAIPELNQHIVQYVNGQIRFMDKFKLAGRKWFKSYEKAYGMYYGVLEQFQGKNVELGLIAAFQDSWMTRLHIPYRSLELGWVGDYNPKLVKLMKMAGGEVVKIHQTYRYWM